MSEAMNPQNQPNPMGPGYPYGSVNRESPTNLRQQVNLDNDMVAAPPPGLVTFAAVMMFVLAAFQILWALVEFVNAYWVSSVTYGTFNGYLWIWGIVDVIVGVAALYAGYDILRGGSYGRVFGVIVAGISALRWFFYIPAEPFMAIVVIAVDILIIYGLVAHGEFFATASARRHQTTNDDEDRLQAHT
jgi:hypothetical protein